MKKTKENIVIPIGSNVKIKELGLFGRIKGFSVNKFNTEYTVLVDFGHKKQKMFFKENELEVV